MCTEREIYLKELVHTTVGLAHPQSVGQARRLEIQVREGVAVLS